ncbi:hypothetical protein ONZ51_g2056 [Trametes cubensis]|uniref:Heterokaryon incompatibility domain-containing protein n=1 Tax=Trametes cubensis TaxID=1111947 RepID=A0AAD7XCD4_9APHY|nr:hypothetical protein ONZ51_g2056 [Trametes cubensis]
MELPPRPHNICALAWESVFAARFGLFQNPMEISDEDEEHWTGGYTYTVSSVVWLECALSGCLWCRFLEKHFLKHIRSWFSDTPIPNKTVDVRVGERAPRSEIHPPGKLPRWLLVILSYGEEAQFEEEFRASAYADDPAADYVQNVSPIPYVGAPHALQYMAKVWMEDCAKEHEVCRQLGTLDSGDWLPTRLIDCSDPGHVRIIETNEKMHGVRYVALSYVWGTGSQAHRTTTANLSARTRVGIAPETLPQTIRDAIYVTRTLEFRFLWLDSLCIIQDSAEDKHREVASMARVYRHAYLTIDAATAASVEEGFLQDRPPFHSRDATFLPFICPASPRDGEVQSEVRVGNLCLDLPRPDDGSGSDEVFENETGRRGWCLQERLLSTRSLIFGESALSVECQARPAAFCVGLDRNIYQVHAGLYDIVPVSGPAAVSAPPGSDNWMKIHRRWQELVQDYSRRSLTYASDKLLACAAIAEVLAPYLGPNYLAGLWPNTVLFDLLWHIWDGSPGLRARPRGYPYAPSWSWASTHRRITFLASVHGALQPIAEAVNHSITLQDSNLQFGPVQPGGYLTLHAAFLLCKWCGNVGKIEHQQHAFEFSRSSYSPSICYFDDDADLQDVFLVPLVVERGVEHLPECTIP